MNDEIEEDVVSKELDSPQYKQILEPKNQLSILRRFGCGLGSVVVGDDDHSTSALAQGSAADRVSERQVQTLGPFCCRVILNWDREVFTGLPLQKAERSRCVCII
jgi:hypothetical protein